MRPVTLPLFACFFLVANHLIAADNWPGFRGDGSSQAPDATPPLEWSDTENVTWSIKLSAYGQSSPVIWDGVVYVTGTQGGKKETLVVTAISLADGKVKWEKSFPASVEIEDTDMVSRGAPTPVVDTAGVYAFFESGDLIALDHAGETRWSTSLTKSYGTFQGGHGLGSSPTQTEGEVIILADHDGPSYLIALSKGSGEVKWKQDRPSRVSWTSPILVDGTLYISSNGILEARDPKTGDPLWSVEGLEGNTVASATVSPEEELIVIGSSQPKMSRAYSLKGDELWTAERVTSSFGSPAIAGDCAYFVNRSGGLQCTSLAEGSLLWEEGLSDSCWASPIEAAGRLYFFCKDGTTFVIQPDAEKMEVLAENHLTALEGDRVYGVAFSGSSIVARTGLTLVCVRAE